MPDGSVRSPEASWVAKEKWNQLSDLQKNEFAPICPDFVIELKNKSDNLKYLTTKMHKWIENGCSLAWLIKPENKTAFIYRKNGTVDKVNSFGNILTGEEVLPDFELNLTLLN